MIRFSVPCVLLGSLSQGSQRGGIIRLSRREEACFHVWVDISLIHPQSVIQESHTQQHPAAVSVLRVNAVFPRRLKVVLLFPFQPHVSFHFPSSCFPRVSALCGILSTRTKVRVLPGGVQMKNDHSPRCALCNCSSMICCVR